MMDECFEIPENLIRMARLSVIIIQVVLIYSSENWIVSKKDEKNNGIWKQNTKQIYGYTQENGGSGTTRR